jgi:hypothetical protein
MSQKLLDLYEPTTGVITNLAALVRVKEVSIGNNVIRKIPFAIDCIEEVELCQDCEPIVDLVPDTPTAEKPKRCIVYFEQNKTTLMGVHQGGAKYNTAISLICWFDSRQFQESNNLTTKLIALFASRIRTPFVLAQNSPIQSVQVVGYTPLDSDPSIFSKYSYSDFRRPYLGCPYGYFKIDFNLNFTINETCLPLQNPIALTGCC